MEDKIIYKKYHNISIVPKSRMDANDMHGHIILSCKIHLVTILLQSDGRIGIKGLRGDRVSRKEYLYGSIKNFLEDWRIINRKVIVEKKGFYI